MFDWFKKKAAKRVEPAPAPVQVPTVLEQTDEYLDRKEKRTVGYIIVSDGVSLVIDGKPYQVGKAHINFSRIVKALEAEQYAKLEELINVATTVQRKTKGIVTVSPEGNVLHNGAPIHNVVADRIVAFLREGLPFQPLARFLENLMTNPDPNSVEQLYAFLEHGGFPITPDGCFLAYKGVTRDFKDKHTQTFDNSVGAKQNMDRSLVDPNPRAACSRGFHVGTHGYATNFVNDGGQVVMVKVNPRDAVSVPEDHNFEKLRVCDYEVVAMCPGKVVAPLSDMGYTGPDYDDEEEDDWSDSVHEEDDLYDDDIEEATGRARGPGGRFLPKS